MKTFIALCLLCLASGPGFGQQNNADPYQRSAELYAQGKFDDAIRLMEKLVATEKRDHKGGPEHATALASLAQFHKEKARRLLLQTSNLKGSELGDARKSAIEAGTKAKKYFDEALEIYQQVNGQQSAEAAAAKTELAWLTYHIYETDSTRDSRLQIDAAERLYIEALETEEKLSPKPIDVHLVTLDSFADFYMRYANFEKALPLYQTYVTAVEAASPNSQKLVAGLRGLARIYMITDRESEAAAIRDRIARITGKPEKAEFDPPILTARSRGIAKPSAGGFIPIKLSDLDRSFSQSAQTRALVNRPGTYTTKHIDVAVTVSETGEVIEANVLTKSKYDREVEAAARASKFRPFVYDGKAQKIRGKISFHYMD